MLYIYIYNNTEYGAADGVVYLEVDLGGGTATSNPNEFTFEMTTVDGKAANFVFEVGIREDTVAGDKISIGRNTIEVLEYSYVACSYKADVDGIYTFTCENEENALIEYNNQDYLGSDGTITITTELLAGEKFEFNVYTNNMEHDYITFTLTVVNTAKLGRNVNAVFFEDDGKTIAVINYVFTAPEDGMYKITPNIEGTYIIYKENYYSDSYTYYGDSFSKELIKGEQLFFYVSRNDFNPGPINFSIEKVEESN